VMGSTNLRTTGRISLLSGPRSLDMICARYAGLTSADFSTHNPPVVRASVSGRLVVALVAFAFVVSSILLPPLHMHVAEDSGGHLHTVVHQHWAAHHWIPTHGASLDDEESATDLDQSIVVPSGFAHSGPAVIDAVAFGDDQAPLGVVTRHDVHARLHGPPLAPASLRAPPLTA